MKAGALVFPAIRWDPVRGFDGAAGDIDRALEIGVGGFILFGGPADRVAALTDRIRRDADRPIRFGADLERGAGQQFAGLREAPPPLALAALDELDLIEAAGAATAREARSVGVDWVYAPVADLDLESTNPIVQTRSFGADPDAVAARVAAWIRGCQGAGASACAKHFPGHGRTLIDSHDRTPVVEASAEELRATDLAPFRAAVEAGVASVMTAHVAFPGLDPSGRAATFSPAILGLLRETLGFRGVVVTDALMMGGAGDSGENPALGALRAGVDGLLYPSDPIAAVEAIERAAADDPALARRVEESARRLAGLHAEPVARVVQAGFDPAGAARRLLDRSAPPALCEPIELVIVDDDLDGAYPPSPSDWTAKALAAAGVRLGPGGSRVVLAFAEPRASKGRAGFGPRARAELGRDLPNADAVVLFGHPRLAAELSAGVPTAVAWHRQRLMQEAAAAWLRRGLR